MPGPETFDWQNIFLMKPSTFRQMKADAQEEQMREEAEQNHFDSLAADLNVDRETLDRWMESA